MANITGQSIAAVSDSVTKNGKGNTIWGAAIGVVSLLALTGGVAAIKVYRDNNKHKNKIKQIDRQHSNAKKRDKARHEYRMQEIDHSAEAKIKVKQCKETTNQKVYESRNQSANHTATFNPDVEPTPEDTSDIVPSYDELIKGKDVEASDLRLGLRCFHIGQDNGLIGRSNIGKTSFLFAFAKAICTNQQDEGAILSNDWCLRQPMKVLYFAFEQGARDYQVKYGKYIKSIPNLHIDVNTSAGDFQSIMKKIKKMQNEIGDNRLLVIFDNITKMKSARGTDGSAFFNWLESYRQECDRNGKPITYLKAYHTQGKYQDHMPIEITTNFGAKVDTYFTQDLVAFGMCKGGDGKLRYLKELKNKIEEEKPTLSVYRFADTQAPMFDFVGEVEEIEALPSKADSVRGNDSASKETNVSVPSRRGPKEKYTERQLREMYEELTAGFTWREILESRDITYQKNKVKGIRKAMDRYNLRPTRTA